MASVSTTGLQQPKGIEWKNYDVLAEFDFAKRCNEAGVVIWSGDDRCDFADGLTNEPFWNWAARAASRLNLPVVVNTQLTDNGAWLLNRFRDETQQRMPGYCGGYYTAGDAGAAGLGHLSWCATAGLDAEMAVQQQTWRNFSKLDTTIEYLDRTANCATVNTTSSRNTVLRRTVLIELFSREPTAR